MEGPDVGKSFPLDKERMTIGRSEEAHVCVEDDLSSRFHAVMTLGPNGYDIRDLRSTNGTIVNGRPIELHSLAHGDSIRIGKTILRYLVEPREPGPARVYEIPG
jgi:pSer/pThr/pTyr-binding forkhead associated (FHA) protein